MAKEENSDYDEDELSAGGQLPPKREFPDVDFGESAHLSGPLNDLLNVQISEYSGLKSKLREAEELVRVRREEEEARRRAAEEELSICTPENTLKALHQVIRNREIINYLETVGDLIVFELDRGMGKNVILFSRIDLAKHREKIEELKSQRPYIENSRRTERDKRKNLGLIDWEIRETSNEIEYISKWGGNIFLYAGRDNQYHHLDLYCRGGGKANRSLALLQVFFGKNRQFEDTFHLFNTPSKIMASVSENIKRYGRREFKRLEARIKEVEEGG